jgi:hypothetical protein
MTKCVVKNGTIQEGKTVDDLINGVEEVIQ